MLPLPPRSTLFPYTTLFRSDLTPLSEGALGGREDLHRRPSALAVPAGAQGTTHLGNARCHMRSKYTESRSEEHTSELSHSQISYAVFCLKKKKKKRRQNGL